MGQVEKDTRQKRTRIAKQEAPAYEPTADVPQYLELNREFIKRNEDMFAVPNGVYIDFGGGTGVIAREIQALHPDVPATIIVLDPNGASIEAGRKITSNDGVRKVVFMHGYAADLENYVAENSADGVVIANAIHEIPESERLGDLKRVNRMLKRGGKLIANSTFMEESMKGHERRWGIWKAKIKEQLKATRNVKAGERTDALSAFVTHPAQHYLDQLEEAGFETEAEPVLVEVPVGVELMKAIAEYATFIEGMCGDLSVPVARRNEIIEEMAARGDKSVKRVRASEKLVKVETEAAVRAVDSMEGDYKSRHPEEDAPPFSIPRGWVEITAVKPSLLEAA